MGATTLICADRTGGMLTMGEDIVMQGTTDGSADMGLLWVLRNDHARGAPWPTADCTVTEGPDGRWTVTVSRGGSTLVTGTFDSRSAALARADRLQRRLLRTGWTNRPSA